MGIELEFPDLSEDAGNPANHLKTARLSQLENQERSAIDEINKPEHNHGPQHRPKHVSMHLPSQDSHCDPELGEKNNYCQDPSSNPPHPHEPPHGPPHGYPKDKHQPDRKGAPPPYIKDPNAPADKGYFVLIIIALFGLVHMMPVTFFFSAIEYWMYKFRNTTSESNDANDRTFLQTNFASLNKLTITLPGVLCNIIAAIGGHKIKAETRVFGVLVIHSSVLVSQAVFVNIDTDDWQVLFFVLTMGSQMVMACSMSLGISGSMGLISKLPPHYMKAQLIGEGISGLFSAVLRLISIFCSPTIIGAALTFFLTGSIMMVGTTFIFYFAMKTKFFKYYTQNSKQERREKIRNIADFVGVLKIVWPMIILSAIPLLFPASSITNLVVSEYHGTESIWGNKYFVTFCTYLIPAVTGLIGRILFSYIDFDWSIPTLYVLVLTKELLFGTLILMSNAKPRHHIPVLLTNDWMYGLMMAGNSLSTGFIMILTTLKSMRMVTKDRIELSMMCTMFVTSVVVAATSPLGVVVVNLL